METRKLNGENTKEMNKNQLKSMSNGKSMKNQ